MDLNIILVKLVCSPRSRKPRSIGSVAIEEVKLGERVLWQLGLVAMEVSDC